MLTSLVVIAKCLFYGGTMLLIGRVLHRLTRITEVPTSNNRIDDLFILSCITVVLSSLLFFLFNAQLNGGLSGMFSMETISWVWAARGKQMILLIAGCLIIALHKTLPKMLKLFGVLLIALSFTATGHIQTISTPIIGAIIGILHIGIASFWVAAPLSLYPSASKSHNMIIERTDRFSTLATRIIGLLFISGAILIYLMLDSVSDLWMTNYGRLLLLKIIIALVLLGIGALNKFRISKILINNTEQGKSALRSTLTIEAVLFSGIMLVLALATTITGPE